MPIYYGSGGLLEPPPWSIDNDLSIKDLSKYKEILADAKRQFPHNHDGVFCSSVKLNQKYKKKFIAEFDMRTTNMQVGAYQMYLENLISTANQILKKKNKNNVRFDIIGSYTSGYIIIMRKNKK